MRIWSLCLIIWSYVSPLYAESAQKDVGKALDSLHESAAKADFKRYFDLFHPEAVFIGTDASERWDLATFKAYAKPHFDAGRGWTYKAGVRHIHFSADKRIAWFDEILESANYGTCRGTGVLVKGAKAGEWLLMQYHLTIPVPNALAKDLVDRIKNQGK